ncbi:MAG: YidH family protein [Nocardioidaceae bacterium]
MAEIPESEQLKAMHRMVELAEQRNQMAAARNYMAAERTLSVWTRTALALMTFGIALDRFGLFLLESSGQQELHSDIPSTWGGAALVAFGIVMAVLTAVRFQRYAAAYRRNHTVPIHHGPFLAPAFAAVAALFGVALLTLLFVVA